jgi:probable rRNA maturation factor
LSIRIFYDNVDFRILHWQKAKQIFQKVIGSENKIAGDLNFIITGDRTIKKINNEFLQHNYFTDVIAFDYGNEHVVSGEVYVSIDTVRKNALNYDVSLKSEVFRVMIHGILHLCGHKDSTEDEKNAMRRLEDHWLKEYENNK